MNLCSILQEHARDRPDELAINEPVRNGNRTLTFRELEERSARAARLLTDSGIGDGDRVLFLHPLSIELYVALIAIFRIGAVATLVDPSAGRAHLRASLRRARAHAFFGSPRAHLLRLVIPEMRGLRPAFHTGSWLPAAIAWKQLERREPRHEIARVSADHGALLTFTSGSTGTPKATLRTHGFLLAQHAALAKAIDLRPGQVDLATLPVFVLANLASAVTTLLPDADLRRPGAIDPEPVRRQLRAHRPDRVVASPAFLERLLAPDDHTLTCFRQVYTGGAPVFPRLLARLQTAIPEARIVAVYGSTEAEPIAHIAWNNISETDLERMYGGAGLLTGHPVDEIALRIVENRAGTPVPSLTRQTFEAWTCPPGTAGEIVVHGEHVVGGYLEGIGDEETKCTVETDRWHRTGDAGYLDDQGRLWLLGRAGAVISDSRGTVYPFAVECAVSRFSWVRRSALVSRNSARLLAVELESAPGDWKAQLRGNLQWIDLDRLVRFERLPVDRRHNAKIDYVRLARMIERSAGGEV